jgi:hypothetical protein
MKKFRFIALDADGEVVLERESKEDYYISELHHFLDLVSKEIYRGEITDIAISRINEGDK